MWITIHNQYTTTQAQVPWTPKLCNFGPIENHLVPNIDSSVRFNRRPKWRTTEKIRSKINWLPTGSRSKCELLVASLGVGCHLQFTQSIPLMIHLLRNTQIAQDCSATLTADHRKRKQWSKLYFSYSADRIFTRCPIPYSFPPIQILRLYENIDKNNKKQMTRVITFWRIWW